MARFLLDVTILTLAAIRLTRLITTDDLGLWLLREPVYRWARFDPMNGEEPRGLKQKAVTGLTCPFCAGFWIGSTLLLSLFLAGGPGHCSSAWEYVTGVFALNYVAAHVSAALDGQGE